MNHRTAIAFVLAALLTPAAAFAQSTGRSACVPGNPLYDRGDYRCFGERPVPTHARPEVSAHVEAARYLSGGALTGYQRETLEDHFDEVANGIADDLPSLVDGEGGLHTPDVRIAVVLLPSGAVGRVRVLSRHGDALDRRIAQSLAAGVSSSEGISLDGSELEVIVRMRPRLRYTRWRAPRHTPCCVEPAFDE
jgi:hypothetical protein